MVREGMNKELDDAWETEHAQAACRRGSGFSLLRKERLSWPFVEAAQDGVTPVICEEKTC